MAALSEAAAKLFSDKNYGQLATIRADGTPHVSVVWVDTDGENVLVNTAKGRAKHRHVARDGRATLHVANNENPYEYVSVTGRATLVDEGADAHIDKLAAKYLGAETYPYRTPTEERVIVRVQPDHVEYFSMG